ncbi:hypothetical protein [Kordia sp.]|uniref:hypothetical protein n=1 Tax=Kordia sp. TaxID=1965332 RepID=UPI003D27E716
MNKLVIGVLGHRNSGKSKTWYSLFGNDKIKTGKKMRKLYLNQSEYVNVFLVSGSPEERNKYVGEIITVHEPSIVLCAMQYRKDVTQTIDYFSDRDYQIYCHWLNPGYKDDNQHFAPDILGIFKYLIDLNASVAIRNGKIDVNPRVQELREYLYGWAKYRNLIIVD